MRFQTPQFIEVEDKIFGPLTLKQFIYLAGGFAICFLAYKFLTLYIAVFIILPVAALAAALAFYKVNNKPFINVVEAALKYTLNSKLYIWKKEAKPVTQKEKEAHDSPSLYIPRLSNSRLRDMTWSLDVKQSMNPVTPPNGGESGVSFGQ
jgi:PrgI family protein